jgi:hypothetical protein
MGKVPAAPVGQRFVRFGLVGRVPLSRCAPVTGARGQSSFLRWKAANMRLRMSWMSRSMRSSRS